MAEDASKCRVVDVVGLYIEFLQFAIFIYLLVVDHLGKDVHASSSDFVVGEIDAPHPAEVGDDQIAEICVDVVIGEINLLKHLNFFNDLSHSLDGQPASQSAVLEIQDSLLSLQLDHLC